jgi:peptidoglycan/xylan/chitin deacetylase (PgdA/CDA1 family)
VLGLARVAGLMYHEITDLPHTSGLQRRSALAYTLSCAAFDRHLEAIASGPLAPELVTGVEPESEGGHLLLTFDDGGRSALYVADELARRGWRAHFFVVTGRIGERTFLDAGAIRHLASCGHVVGSHSHSHPDIFRALSRPAMLEEWRTSCDILASLLGRPCTAASVPGGDISPAVLGVAAEAGLRVLFTSEPLLRPIRVGRCWVFGRFCVKAGTPVSRVSDLIRLRGWRRALLERRLKEIARRSFSGLYEAYVHYVTRPRLRSRTAPPPGATRPASRFG